MKTVQEALAPVIAEGVPCMEGIWRTDSKNQNPPKQYVVYSQMVEEASHSDDLPDEYKTTVYIDFWSKTDPTEIRNLIRTSMYDAGFAMFSESSKGYNQPAYDNYTHQYCIQWEWILFTGAIPE